MYDSLPKTVNKKGKREVALLTNVERGESIAISRYAKHQEYICPPPVPTFMGMRKCPELKYDLPPASAVEMNDNHWSDDFSHEVDGDDRKIERTRFFHIQ